MKTRSIYGVLAASGLTAAASGQMITTPGITARLDLSWQEDPAFPHNDNGLLETGEHALILMTASFTGQFTQVSFSPPVGAFSSGTILGLGSAYQDIRSASADPTGLYNGGITAPTSTSVGPNADEAGTSGYGVRGGWRLGGNAANGYAGANGSLSIGPGQIPLSPGSVNTTNPIANLDRLGWAPSSYADRTVVFSAVPDGQNNLVGLYLDLDGMQGGYAYLGGNQVTFGHVSIPIRSIPGPSSLLVLIGPIVARRRRRRGAAKEGPQ